MPRGETGPVTDCLWHHMCGCLSWKVFSRMHTWSQTQLWISESSVKHFATWIKTKCHSLLNASVHHSCTLKATADYWCTLLTVNSGLYCRKRWKDSGMSSWNLWLLDAYFFLEMNWKLIDRIIELPRLLSLWTQSENAYQQLWVWNHWICFEETASHVWGVNKNRHLKPKQNCFLA